ncbi:MAG: tetratricopeptide repeat protein [Gemmatimonadetes bacterium]|nr:tetratricopeptide repeat protein [Gemmatimonadota bacterium]
MIGLRGLLLSLLTLALVSGCGDDNTTNNDNGNDPTAASRTTEGWESYGRGDMTTAREKFRSAITLDAGHAPAHSGLGWALAADDSLDAAVTAWDEALGIDAGFTDAYAGKALALFAGESPDPAGAITAAGEALSREPRYDFSMDDVDWTDLRLLLGNAYVQTGEYSSAAAQIDSLGGTSPDPSSDTYEQDIIAFLEALAN